METDMPPCVHVKCQGKPGTGKPFVILTPRSITRKFLESTMCNVASAPTGCAAMLMSDEDSMTGRGIWAWLEHRACETRKYIPPHLILLPVGMKSIHSSKPAVNVHTSDFVGVSSLKCFVNRHSSTGTESLVVMMDEVIRQQDPEFWGVLDAIQNGAIKESHVGFLVLHCLSNLLPEEKDKFKDALHIIPTWKQTVPTTVQYLKQLNIPITKVVAKISTKKVTGKNNCIKECSYPSLV
eukprot:2748997-Ditylum_brightwellii.AAC.1